MLNVNMAMKIQPNRIDSEKRNIAIKTTNKRLSTTPVRSSISPKSNGKSLKSQGIMLAI